MKTEAGGLPDAGKLVFGIFAALAECEREMISERTRDGHASARARGRKGRRKLKMTPAKLRLAMSAMGRKDTIVTDLCEELGVSTQTLYRYVSLPGSYARMGRRCCAPDAAGWGGVCGWYDRVKLFDRC